MIYVISVPTKRISEEVQKKLFSLGYYWPHDKEHNEGVQHWHKPVLVVNTVGECRSAGCIQHSPDFYGHPPLTIEGLFSGKLPRFDPLRVFITRGVDEMGTRVLHVDEKEYSEETVRNALRAYVPEEITPIKGGAQCPNTD
jgi:hypothetical protein